MEKLDYFIRRLILVVPTFIGITMLCFGIIQFVPGGPVEQVIMQMRGMGATESGRGGGSVALSGWGGGALAGRISPDFTFSR